MREITLFPGESVTLADGTRVVAAALPAPVDASANSRGLKADGQPAAPDGARGALGRACDLAGSQVALAHAIGFLPQQVHNWLTRDKSIPTDACVEIERAFGVSRAELRPADFWKHWPDLAAPVKDQTDA